MLPKITLLKKLFVRQGGLPEQSTIVRAGCQSSVPLSGRVARAEYHCQGGLPEYHCQGGLPQSTIVRAGYQSTIVQCPCGELSVGHWGNYINLLFVVRKC